MSDTPTLLGIENRSWDVMSTTPEQVREFYDSLLADDAQVIFAGGMRLANREQILEALTQMRWPSCEIWGAETTAVSDEGGLLTYKFRARDWRGSVAFQALTSAAYAWIHGSWKLVFRQQTLL